mmetsp:Transcript_8884/g.26775  ORF Transcript_8884/g.26775 Transcript_8884/m.26775 type:complete len:264 (-) Transcript_8884:42-833(-)
MPPARRRQAVAVARRRAAARPTETAPPRCLATTTRRRGRRAGWGVLWQSACRAACRPTGAGRESTRMRWRGESTRPLPDWCVAGGESVAGGALLEVPANLVRRRVRRRSRAGLGRRRTRPRPSSPRSGATTGRRPSGWPAHSRRRRTSRTRSSVSTTSTSTSTDTRRGRRSSSRSPRPRWRESTPRRPPPRPPHTRSANAPESPTWAVAARSCLVALLVLSSREARGSAAATARVRRCVGPFISPLFILVYSHTKNPLRTKAD